MRFTLCINTVSIIELECVGVYNACVYNRKINFLKSIYFYASPHLKMTPFLKIK